MTRAELLSFLRQSRVAVEATAAEDGTPQAAVVGIAVSDGLEIIFDTLESTRKYANLRADPRIALVVVRPSQIRFSDFTATPPLFVTFGPNELEK
jgi:predicted pyridoxine 5'-phosphate oxidase superfamily flavin-nucleotide-binding protein